MKTKSRLLCFIAGCVVGVILAVVGLAFIPSMSATPLTVSQHSKGNFVVAAHRDDGIVHVLVADEQSFVLPEGCVFVGISPDGSVIIEEEGQIYRLSAISNEAVRDELQAEPDGTVTLMNSRTPSP